jgi:type II secretory pathway component PulF
MAISIDQNPKSIQTEASRSKSTPPNRPKPWTGTGWFRGASRSIKPHEIMFFISQLSLMLEIETPLTTALEAIGDEIQNPAFKAVITEIHQDIKGGRQLSEAMKRHPRIFDKQFISMVSAGETGGFLKRVLDRDVERREKRQALMTQLRSSMTYPIVLCGLGVVVVVFILVGVLPKFTAFFQGKESILPWTTRFLMAASASLRQYWWIYVAASAGLVAGFIAWKRSKQGRALADLFFIKGPIISGLANKIYTGDLLRTLGYLLESQVPLPEALTVTRPTIRNQYYRHFVDRIKDTVDQGGRFARPFTEYPYIPETVKQMVAVGEEAGKLPFVMLRLSAYYDVEIEQALKKFAAMIEPVALIIMGGIVGGIVSSVILPLFKLSQALR